MYDIIIVGAGAAGLSAAVQAVMIKPDVKILILEKGNKCGRKLSASGNGRCNLTNSVFTVDRYNSMTLSFIEDFINNNSYKDVIFFFERCGMPVYEKLGYYYPVSDMAKQVTARLTQICALNGVTIEYDKCVTDVLTFNDKHYYMVKTPEAEYRSKKVIIATGSSSYPGLGGSASGYDLTKKLKISLTDVYPVLTPVYVDDDKLSVAQGVRINADITLNTGDSVIKESGQIQINNNNLSGIAIMNISCHLPLINEDLLKDCIYVDFYRDISWDSLKKYIIEQCAGNTCYDVLSLLEGIFPTKFAKYMLAKVNIEPSIKVSQISEKQINILTSNIKKMRYTPMHKFDNDKSQASLGGVKLDEIISGSYESRKYKGLYIVGELLDVTGKCGGYNLTFAFLSGINAAKSAVNDL